MIIISYLFSCIAESDTDLRGFLRTGTSNDIACTVFPTTPGCGRQGTLWVRSRASTTDDTWIAGALFGCTIVGVLLFGDVLVSLVDSTGTSM